MGKYPYHYHPNNDFGGAWGLDWAVGDPNFIAASLAPPTTFNPIDSGYSLDGGYTWSRFSSLPLNSTGIDTFACGSIAVGSTNNIVWVSAQSKGAYGTTNRGASWTSLSVPGVDNTTLHSAAYYVQRRIICSDKATPNIFYLYAINVGFFRSTHGGVTWVQRSNHSPWEQPGYTNNWAWHVVLRAVPGNEGHLYMASGDLTGVTDAPFLRSTDGGATWSILPDIRTVRGFGFGRAAPGKAYPTIYAIAYVNGVYGVYRSIDQAVSWTSLGVTPTDTLDSIRHLDADKDVFGKFYMQTVGSGVITGQLSS